MHYRVSTAYLAERRGGPLRASLMIGSVFLFIAFLAFWQRDQSKSESILPGMAITGVMMVAIGFFVVRRMAKMTTAFEKLIVTVTPEGFEVESANGSFTIKASEIRGITMYRTLMPPKICFFVLAGQHWGAALPPLENAESFAQEIRDAMPNIPFASKRRFMANFGG